MHVIVDTAMTELLQIIRDTQESTDGVNQECVISFRTRTSYVLGVLKVGLRYSYLVFAHSTGLGLGVVPLNISVTCIVCVDVGWY